MTRFTPEYLEFREKLPNDYLVKLSLKLQDLNAERGLPENTMKIVKVGAELVCHIYVDKSDGTIWLLGGHWVKDGVSNVEYLTRMRFYAAELLAGREPR